MIIGIYIFLINGHILIAKGKQCRKDFFFIHRWFDGKLQLIRVTHSDQRFYAPKYFLEHPDLYRSLLYHPGHERNFNRTWRPPWLSADGFIAVSFFVKSDFVIYKAARKYQLLHLFVEMVMKKYIFIISLFLLIYYPLDSTQTFFSLVHLLHNENKINKWIIQNTQKERTEGSLNAEGTEQRFLFCGVLETVTRGSARKYNKDKEIQKN